MSKKKKTLKDKVNDLQSKNPKVEEKPLLNEDIYRIHIGLSSCQGFRGRNFSYMVAENARMIEHYKDKLEKSVEKDLTEPHSIQLKEYREKLSDLRSEYKAIPGKEIAEQYIELEKKLTDEYKECLDAFNESRKEMLEDKAKIKVATIDIKDVPEEITGGLMADIFECIKK